MIDGFHVFDARTGAPRQPTKLSSGMVDFSGEFSAIADFNGDDRPDIALVQPGTGEMQLSIFDYANNRYIVEPRAVPFPGSNQAGGPPTVDDFDGDGTPDVAVAGDLSFCVFSTRCLDAPTAPGCDAQTPGALWCARTQDHSSGVCGSTSFDFDEDGLPEVVYRDECWLRILDGRTGRTRVATSMTSGTLVEYPIVADVDGDGQVEIVVTGWGDNHLCPGSADPETGTPWSGSTYGVYVFRAARGAWPGGRALWSSHAYHVTEIRDDSSLPRTEPPSWTTHNTYRRNLNSPARESPLQPDFTASRAGDSIDAWSSDCAQGVTLAARICNRGTRAARSGVPATFYLSDPRAHDPVVACVARTESGIPSGSCLDVSCRWEPAATGPVDLWFRANDDSMASQPVRECKLGNNLLFIPKVECRTIR